MWKCYYSTTSCKKGGKEQTEQWKEQTEQWKGFYSLLNGKQKDLQLKDYCHELC
jgi:hypothetical protein